MSRPKENEPFAKERRRGEARLRVVTRGSRVATRRREEQLLQLEHTVARSLGEADTASSGLQSVIRAICESEHWDCGRYFALVEGAGALQFREAWGRPGSAIEALVERSRAQAYPPGVGLSGAVLESRQPLWIPNIGTEPRAIKYPLEFGMRSAFLFAIVSKTRRFGLLAFNSRQIREPDERLLQAVRVIGTQIGNFLQSKEAEEVLRESEERFRNLTELSTDWYWEQDAKLRFTRVAGRTVGAGSPANPDIMIGKTRWEAAATVLAGTWDDHRRVLEAHQPFYDLELRVVDRSGHEYFISTSGLPYFDAAGVFQGYRGNGRDITARVREERLLRLEHLVARSLAESDSASAGLKAVIRAVCETQNWDCGRYWRVDEQAAVLRFSESWNKPDPKIERFIASKRDATARRGAGLAGRVWETGRPAWVSNVRREAHSLQNAVTLETGMQGAFHFPVISEGRLIGVLAFNSRDVREPDQRLLEAVRVIGSQIGQFLRRMEGQEELERFRAAMDTSSDMIMLVDRATMRYVDINATACDMQGYTREEMLSMGPHDVAGIDRADLERAYDAMISGGRTTWQRSTHKRKDGTLVPIEVFRRAVRTDRGWIIVSILRDVSERARAEQLQNLEHGVARALSGAETASGAIRAVIQALCESEGWECGRYFHVDQAAGVLRFEDAWHISDPALAQFVAKSREAVYASGAGLIGRVWANGEPLWSTDLTNDPRALKRGHSLTSGMRAAFIFPVTAAGRTIGLLSFSSRHARDPDEGLLKAVHVIGSQVGQFMQRKQAEAVLRESEARFRSLTQLSSDWYWEQDAEYRFVEITNEIDGKTGVAPLSQIGKRRWELAAPNMTDADWAGHRAVVEAHRPFHDLELCRISQDGTERWVTISGEPIFATDGSFKGYRGIGKDITARKREERMLRLEHTVTRTLAEAESASAGLKAVIRALCEAEGWPCGRYFHTDEAAGVLRFEEAWGVVDPAVERFIANSRETVYLRGQGLSGRVWESGEPLWANDVSKDSRSSGTSRRSSGVQGGALVFPVISDGKTIGVLSLSGHEAREPDTRLLQAVHVIGSQIGQFFQRKNAEDRLAHLAQFDTVTGLPNRHLFRDRLDQTLTQARRNNWLIGVLFVDLDRFKAVNDTYGHGAGDKLLGQTASRLKDCIRTGDTVGRISGDEFAVVLSNLAKPDDAGLVVQKIVQALASPFEIDGHQTYVTASIGIALYPADGGDADTLLKNADTAMYRAKGQGRNGYQFYLPEMNERLTQRMKFETHLRGALERGEFLLNYQPKVGLASGDITGFEALLRWRHGDLMVSPAEFIPILEETGLIVPVGEWVLRTVCEQLKQWEREGFPVKPVAVNLSARQFQRKNLAELVEQVLRETGVDAQLLELELTETLVMSDAQEAAQTLRALKALGVRLAVDDFGTGYSSLAYLRRFPLDTLKIDRAFIRDVVGNPDDATLALTIIGLAHGLKLKVVAEGVETEAQLDFLRLHGCDEMQGFFFSRPQPVAECTRMLAEGRRLQNMPVQTMPGLPVLLLVDDAETDLLLLKDALAPEGFRILTADGPKAALDALASKAIHIVIADHYMPEMSGAAFLSKVRTLYPKTVRIVASGDDSGRTLIEAINSAGIHKYLSKSWDPDRLRAEVREAYERR